MTVMPISASNASDLQSWITLFQKHPLYSALGVIAILIIVYFLSLVSGIGQSHSNWLTRKMSKFKQGPDKVSVLVIDDKHRSFPIRKILSDHNKYPWIDYNSIPDLKSIDDPILENADLVFVDINGVGRILTPITQGLGLAEEILNTYPKKTVVVYSSDIKQDMTHPVLTRVAGRLYKEDEPRNFIKYAEDLRKH